MRGWIDGLPLHIAKPHGECDYFRSAKAALRKLHRAGICHNDLAKEQNWLRGRDGRAYLTDFQLAARFSRRNWLFRIAAYEDLRHLLKHKRRYAPDALTAAERRVLANKSLLTRIWMATGKKVYYWITRGLLRFTDREGGGPRLVHDAPRIAARLKTHPQVRDAVDRGLSRPPRRHRALCLRRRRAWAYRAAALREFIAAETRPAAQTARSTSAGDRRTAAAILRRSAQRNPAARRHEPGRLDRPADRRASRSATLVARIVADRRNLRDRI